MLYHNLANFWHCDSQPRRAVSWIFILSATVLAADQLNTSHSYHRNFAVITISSKLHLNLLVLLASRVSLGHALWKMSSISNDEYFNSCSNRMNELCCICCTFSLPFLISVFVCSHHILYMWLLGLNHTAACQVTQAFDVYIHTVNIYSCLSQAPYLSALADNKSSHTNWVYWKYSAAESGHCDGKRLRWHRKVRHLLSSQAVDMIHWYLTKSNFNNVLSKFY